MSHDPVAMGYTVGMNQFMDLTTEEFKATMLTAKPISDQDYMTGEYLIHDNEDTAGVPSSVNWVTAGKVSAIKN